MCTCRYRATYRARGLLMAQHRDEATARAGEAVLKGRRERSEHLARAGIFMA